MLLFIMQLLMTIMAGFATIYTGIHMYQKMMVGSLPVINYAGLILMILSVIAMIYLDVLQYRRFKRRAE